MGGVGREEEERGGGGKREGEEGGREVELQCPYLCSTKL